MSGISTISTVVTPASTTQLTKKHISVIATLPDQPHTFAMGEGDIPSRKSSRSDLHCDVVSTRREEHIKQKEADLAARESQLRRSEQEIRQQKEAAEDDLAARQEQLHQQERQEEAAEADLAVR